MTYEYSVYIVCTRISKAFDKIEHKYLLNKRKHLNTPTYLYYITKRFLLYFCLLESTSIFLTFISEIRNQRLEYF